MIERIGVQYQISMIWKMATYQAYEEGGSKVMQELKRHTDAVSE